MKKSDKIIEHQHHQVSQQSQQNQGSGAMMTELKKCMLEMSLVGLIRDDLKLSDGMQYEVKIGDELVAKWFEPKSYSYANGLIKKIRFPFKFRFLNSKISVEVNPIPDEKSLNLMTKDELDIQDYTICKKSFLANQLSIDHGIYDFNSVLKNLQVLTPAFQVPVILDNSLNTLQLSMQEHRLSHHITIKFFVQLSKPQAYLLNTDLYTIKMCEDNGFYFSRIKIVKIEQMNEQCVQITICIPHYEEQTFAQRQFIINFEQKEQAKQKSSFITQQIYIHGSIKFKGQDFQDIEKQQIQLERTSLSERNKQKQEVLDIKSILIGSNEESKVNMENVERKMEIVDEINPYISHPRKHVDFYSQDMQQIGRSMLLGPVVSESYTSLIDVLNQGQLQVVPLIAVDFSLANLTFLDDQCLHSTKSDKPNDYKDVLKMIGESYSNILNIPVFGYSAKTTQTATQSAPFFPLSMDLRNPFVTNDPELIDESYTKCLKNLELATPINLLPVISLVKQLGINVRQKIDENNGRIDCFYVLYILSPGLIDDLPDLLETLDSSWDGLPLQIHLINLSTNNIISEDLDTIKFQDYTMKYNLQQSCWLQFNVHFYDRIKSKHGHRPDSALYQLKETAIESVPKEIETYLFLNQLKANKFAFKGEAVQLSLMNVINLMEEKTALLFKQAEELGVDKELVEKMIHQQKLFEWNIETLQSMISNQNNSDNDHEKQTRKKII